MATENDDGVLGILGRSWRRVGKSWLGSGRSWGLWGRPGRVLGGPGGVPAGPRTPTKAICEVGFGSNLAKTRRRVC